MKKIGAGIYYNNNNGYIIVANVVIKDKFGSAFIYPPLSCAADVSYKSLGEIINQALKISESTEPLSWEEAMTQGEFWSVSGLKTFGQFCKNYARVSVRREENQYILSKWEPKRNGYLLDVSFPEKKISVTIEEELFGKEVKQLLDMEKNVETESQFSTLSGSIVKYRKMPDNYIDLGDGNIDAYQVYGYERDSKTRIAFMIDNEYESVDKEMILNKWVNWFGECELFAYESIEDNPLCAVANWENKNAIVKANYFNDKNDFLEVIVVIYKESLSKEDSEQVINDYNQLIKSITIE